jgi:hypothetical protein
MTRANLSLRSALFPLTWASLALILGLAAFMGGYCCGYYDG